MVKEPIERRLWRTGTLACLTAMELFWRREAEIEELEQLLAAYRSGELVEKR